MTRALWLCVCLFFPPWKMRWFYAVTERTEPWRMGLYFRAWFNQLRHTFNHLPVTNSAQGWNFLFLHPSFRPSFLSLSTSFPLVCALCQAAGYMLGAWWWTKWSQTQLHRTDGLAGDTHTHTHTHTHIHTCLLSVADRIVLDVGERNRRIKNYSNVLGISLKSSG